MPEKANAEIRGATLRFGTSTSTDPQAIAAGGSTTVDIEVPGAQTPDMVFVQPKDGLHGSLGVQRAFVSADDVVTIRIFNYSGSNVNDNATDYDYMLVKLDNANDAVT